MSHGYSAAFILFIDIFFKKFEIFNAILDDLRINIIDETLWSRLMEKNI